MYDPQKTIAAIEKRSREKIDSMCATPSTEEERKAFDIWYEGNKHKTMEELMQNAEVAVECG